jgi:hypothetical protein
MRVGEWISDSITSPTVSLGLFNNGLLCLQVGGSPSVQVQSIWCSTNTVASNTTSNGGYSLILNMDGTICVKLSPSTTIWCNTQYPNVAPNQQFMLAIDSDKIGISVTAFMGIFWSSPRPYTQPIKVYTTHDLESRDRCAANILQGYPKQVYGSDYCGFSIQDPPVNGIQFISTSPSINNGAIPSVKTTLYCPARNNDTTASFSPSPGDSFYVLCQAYSQVTQSQATSLYTVNPVTITPCPGVMQIPFYIISPYPGPGISITYPTYSYPGYVWVNITVDAEVLNANATTSYFNSAYHDRVFTARSYKLLNSGCECRQATPGQLERTGTGALCQQECSFFTEFRTQNMANTYSSGVSGSSPDTGYYCGSDASLKAYPGNTYTRTTQSYGSGSCPSCTQFIFYKSQQDVCGKYYTGSVIMPRSFHYLSPINHQVCLSLLPVQIVTITLPFGSYLVNSLQCEWPGDWMSTSRSLIITSNNGFVQTLRCFTFNLQQNSMFFQTVNMQKHTVGSTNIAYGVYIGATGIDSIVTCTDTTSCGSQCATTCPVLYNVYDLFTSPDGVEPLSQCAGVSDCNRYYCDLSTCISKCQTPLASTTINPSGQSALTYCAPTVCPPSMYGAICADACPDCDLLLKGSICNDGKTGDGTCHCPTGMVLDGDASACVDPTSICSTSINHLYGPSPFDTSCVPAPGVSVDHSAYVLIIPYLTTQFPIVSITYICDVPVPVQYTPTQSIGGTYINTRSVLCSGVSHQQFVIHTVVASTIGRFSFYNPAVGGHPSVTTTLPPTPLTTEVPIDQTLFTTFCNGHGKVKLHTRVHTRDEFVGYYDATYKFYEYMPVSLSDVAFGMQGNISSYGMYLFYNNMNPNAANIPYGTAPGVTYPEDYPDMTSTCYCDSGWWGASCNTTCPVYIPGVQFCDPHNITNIICSDYATYNPTSGFCVANTCPPDRAGQQCHLQCPLCSSDQYCKNGLNGDGRCYCSDPRLQIDPVSHTCVPDLCGPVNNICFGNGVCHSATTTQYGYCVCNAGFEPPFCQHPVYNAIAPGKSCNCGQKWNTPVNFNNVLCVDQVHCQGGIYPMIIQDRGWLSSVIQEIAIATSVNGFLYDTRNSSVTVTTGNGLLVPLGGDADPYSNLYYICATTFGCTGFVVYQPSPQSSHVAVFTTDQPSLRALSITTVTTPLLNTTIGVDIPQPLSSDPYYTLAWYQNQNCSSPTLDLAYYYFDSGLRSQIDATYCGTITPNSLYNGVCYLLDLYDVNTAHEIGTSSCFRYNSQTGGYTLNAVCSSLSTDTARQYTDMAWAARAKAHWQTEGFIEGRNPNANCRLQPTLMDPRSNCSTYTVGCGQQCLNGKTTCGSGCTGHGFCSYVNQSNPSLGQQCDCYARTSNNIWSPLTLGSLYSGQYCDTTTLTCVKPCPIPQPQGTVCDTSFCSGVGQCTYFATGADGSLAIDQCVCPVGRSGTWCETIATGCNNACTIQDSVANPQNQDPGSICSNTATAGIVACHCGQRSFGPYCEHDAVNCINPSAQQNVMCSGPSQGICIAGAVDASTTRCQCLTTTVPAPAGNPISNVPYQGAYCQYQPCALVSGHGTCTLRSDGSSTVACYPAYNTQSNGCRDSQCSAGILNNTACRCQTSPSSNTPQPYYVTMSGKSGPLSVCFNPCPVDFNGVQCGAYVGQIVSNPISSQHMCVPKNWDTSIESVCQCATGYCPTNGVCTPYCFNGGVLQGSWDSSYCTSAFPPICTCPQHYSGSQCATFNGPQPTTRPPTTLSPTTITPTTNLFSTSSTTPLPTTTAPTHLTTTTATAMSSSSTGTIVATNTTSSSSSQSTFTTLPVIIGITVGGVVAISAVVYIVVHFVLNQSIIGFTQLTRAAPALVST